MLEWLKEVSRIFFLCLILLGSSYGAYYLYQRYERCRAYETLLAKRPTLKRAKDGTSVSAARYKEKEFEKKLSKKYPRIYTSSFDTPALTYAGRNTAILGLASTKAHDFSRKRMDLATDVMPRGTAFADKYMLISAYDGSHKYSPVIWVLNKQTGKYIKTLQTGGRPYLGGIVYDLVARNIWVISSSDGESAPASFSLRELRNNKGERPIKYNNQMALPDISHASTVTYFDNQLFVSFSSTYEKGTISGYTIARSGDFKRSITADGTKASTGSAVRSTATGSASMNKQI